MKPKRTNTEPPDSLSRRALLEWAGIALTGAALPAQATSLGTSSPQSVSAKSTGSVMNELSTYMSDAANRPLPAEVAEKAKHHILDTLAAMISGSKLLPGQRAFQFLETYRSNGDATVVASKIVCGPIESAFANGMQHSLNR